MNGDERNRILKTRRLLPASFSHTEDIYLHFDRQTTTYMEPAPFTELQQARAAVARFIRQREEGTDFVYAVTSKRNKEFIGVAGLHNVKSDSPEVGVWICTRFYGRHFGREARWAG